MTTSLPPIGVAPPAVAEPPTVTGPGVLPQVAVAVAGVLATAAVVLVGLTSPEGPGAASVVLACWVSVPYVVSGLVSWRRRPDSRLGVLMLATGFATFANFLVWARSDLLFTFGLAVQFLPPVLLLHLFLAFPSGRLTTRASRVVVVAAYALAALTIPDLLLGFEAPRNVLAVRDLPAAATTLLDVELLGLSALLLAGVVLLAWRRHRDGPSVRRAVDLLVQAASLGLVMIAVLLLMGVLDWNTAGDTIRLVAFAIIGSAPIVFLAGLLHARLGRASVEGLVAELGQRPRPAEVQVAVARALRDPSATVAYWVPEYDSWADIDGRQVDLAPVPGRTATPVRHGGATVAVVLHDPTLDDEPELLAAVASVVGLTVENARLHVELRARIEEVRGSRERILQAEEGERRRLERDLHDGAQQRLVALSLELGRLRRDVAAGVDGPSTASPRPPVAETTDLVMRLDSARDTVQTSLDELRALAHGIYPATLADHGLAVALESLATDSTVPVVVEGSPDRRLPAPVELATHYVVSECLTNVMKHAHASAVTVRLDQVDSTLVVEVSDDGVGGVTGHDGSGLRGLADRVEAIGGTLHVTSPAGVGTTVRVELPCAP
ncbi:sensor histidine kinase [Salsipaludibacter albus]|uniref:sensor histidine kinase n=1 Tax=Salsipaludibacter albus TaxID=2849650 RepID=UPI001EE47582|nr:ATP-binding protein [Salsipaludibacter albus]MBY5162140.1 hypothetical protein [Salsipaludibacter albus]